MIQIAIIIAWCCVVYLEWNNWHIPTKKQRKPSPPPPTPTPKKTTTFIHNHNTGIIEKKEFELKL